MSKRFFPNSEQLPLMQACLLRDEEAARAAWRKWKARVDLNDMDPSCFRIMSLAYRRMIDLGINDPDAGRIKGLYRYHWTRNQIAWRGKDRVLRELVALGIPTVLLKGAALSRTVYKEPTTRGMHDLDVLVPVKDAARVMALLKSEGWIAQHFAAVQTIDFFHGCSFLHPEFGELDLHWHVMRASCRNERTEELWAGTRELVVDGIPTRVLCPADMFLHACEHGSHPSPASSLQWLVDATMVVRNSGADFDWDRLVDQARKFQLVLMVRSTLRFIRRHFEPDLPREQLRKIEAAPVTAVEQVAYFFAGRPEGRRGMVHRAIVAWCHHYKMRQGTQPLREIARGFPLYFQYQIHEKRPWPVVFDEEWRTWKRKLWDDLQEWKYRLGRMVRLKSAPHGGLIIDLPQERLRHFYGIEKEFGSSFRWSETAAGIELWAPRVPMVLRFEFRPVRDLTRLFEDGLVIRVNGHPIPRESIRQNGRFLLATVSVDVLRDDGYQKLWWTIHAWPAPGDPRQLGLPLSRFWWYRGRTATA